MSKMLTLGSSIVSRLSSLHTEKIELHRILSNTRFSHEDLLNGSFKFCVSNTDTNHVLAIQDATDFNYRDIKSKSGFEYLDVGLTGSSKIAGFFYHPMLVVNPKSNVLIGVSSIRIYNRIWGQAGKKNKNI